MFNFFNISELDYYIKIFLGEKVAVNLVADFKLMQKLGELYPRQPKILPALDMGPLENLPHIYIYTMFLDGIDVFKNEYINN